MGYLVNQLRHILRRLLRAPMFTGITILTLAIGIGANTAIFSVINGILLKPLPYADSGRLVSLWLVAPGLGIMPGVGRLPMSPALYFTFRDQGRAFEDIGLWQNGSATITGLAEPEEVPSVAVTDRTLPTLGVQPAVGRWFTTAEDSPGGPDTVILSYEYWQRRFGGDKGAVGKPLVVNGRQREIIGVMPPGFRILDTRAALILPMRLERANLSLGNHSFRGVARLRTGVTLAGAGADAARMIPIMFRNFPPPAAVSLKIFQDAQLAPRLQWLKEDLVGNLRRVLWILMGTIGMVLLIACANVANLFLVRAQGRRQELAVRAALGASRSRIARELLLESLGLGLAGGIAGLGLAYGALRLLLALAPATLPRLDSISLDPAVLLFALGVSLFAGLLFGFIPALQCGSSLETALHGGGRSQSDSRERHRARSALVAVQVALALVLLISSGLMIRTFQALRRVSPGFARPDEIQTLRISIPPAEIRDPNRVLRAENDILEKLLQVPGVSSAAFASSMPMDGYNSYDPIFTENRAHTEGETLPMRRFTFVSPGFFQTLGDPLIAGRDLTWSDIYESRPVTLVSQNLAREMWGSAGGAIGKRIRADITGQWREIVGVVGDLAVDGVDQKAPPTVFWPVLMRGFRSQDTYANRSVAFAVRSARTGSEGFLKQIQQAAWSVDPNLPLAEVSTLGELYSKSMARTSFTLVMLAIAGAMALLLSIVGVYGVISYSVSQRTREIGIRMALGAPQSQLRGMFLRHGLALAGAGVACGLAAAFAGARLMTSLLFGVSPIDPVTYAAVSAGLIAAALLASYLPARRASSVAPVDALRTD